MYNTQNIINISLVNHIDKHSYYKDEIFDALHVLLNGHYVKYNLEKNISNNDSVLLNHNDFQRIFSNLSRKEKGIYYTPKDVADYIISNTVTTNVLDLNHLLNSDNALDALSKSDPKAIKDIIFKKTFIDPTCGSGEFLVSVANWKIKLSEKAKITLQDKDYLKICETIFGNDIEGESVDIAKMRLFFAIAPFLTNSDSFKNLSLTLNSHFFNHDFILDYKKINYTFDYIIGNPPYVEYSKYSRKSELKTSYGNIYADTIANSFSMLKKGGGLGFLIPISYTSTARMHKIRKKVEENCTKEIILNYADRPDCLFVGAHQKINILITKKGTSKCETYTSNYKHWYKRERKDLINGREIINAGIKFDDFIPKIGNAIEKSIFQKISKSYSSNLNNLQVETGENIYLNMRACFWVKAFSFNPGSKEYKIFAYDKTMKDFVACVLNSTLFWLYWTIVSDCWHLTSKELKGFSVPETLGNSKIFRKLSKQLESKLEKTKVYIGTAQAKYEYKHKLCKKEIDEIDAALAKIYKLTTEELKYVQGFALKYRLGGGIDA